MKLMTKTLEKAFAKYPIYSQENAGENAKVIAHYFFGGCDWYITEANKLENGDYEMFGLCKIQEAELGYVMLSQLEALGVVERDLYFTPCEKTLKEVREEI